MLGYLLAMASVKTTGIFESRVEKHLDLRRVEYTILEMLAFNPDYRANQIARLLNFTRPSTSAWIDKMQAKGLLLRQPDPTDMRAVRLEVTDAGRQLLNEAREAIQEGESGVMGPLTPAEQAMLKELLAKFAFGPRRG